MTARHTDPRPWECRAAFSGGHFIMTRAGSTPLDPVAWTYSKKLGDDIARALNNLDTQRAALRDIADSAKGSDDDLVAEVRNVLMKAGVAL